VNLLASYPYASYPYTERTLHVGQDG